MGKKWESYSTLENTLIIGPPIGILILAALFALSVLGIFSSVKSICTEAQKEFAHSQYFEYSNLINES